jgi:hypothetical protein
VHPVGSEATQIRHWRAGGGGGGGGWLSRDTDGEREGERLVPLEQSTRSQIRERPVFLKSSLGSVVVYILFIFNKIYYLCLVKYIMYV